LGGAAGTRFLRFGLKPAAINKVTVAREPKCRIYTVTGDPGF
jgi:hypothetical protein